MSSQKEGRERRRAPRVKLKIRLAVTMQSLGTHSPHEFFTSDVSIGGIFVHTTEQQDPFNPQSLLEVTLKPDGREKIDFMGKMAHRQSVGFGVRIVQIEDVELAKLTTLVNDHMHLKDE